MQSQRAFRLFLIREVAATYLASAEAAEPIGYASAELSNLVGPGTRTWSVGPSLNVPVLNLGRTRGNLKVANARQTIAVASYERTIQTAFREVSDALAGRRYLADQVDAQERGTAAQHRIAELARNRYDEGVVNFIEVLDAERNLFAAEQAMLQLRRAQVENLITLYIALGGGVVE